MRESRQREPAAQLALVLIVPQVSLLRNTKGDIFYMWVVNHLIQKHLVVLSECEHGIVPTPCCEPIDTAKSQPGNEDLY